MVFHQNGSTLTYWADDNTDWNVSGTISNAINPFWIITLTFPLVWFWKWLDQRGKEPSTPTKIAIGMFLTGVSFTILFFAARDGESRQVQSSMFAAGSFRVTERGLDALRAEGVPADVLAKLEAKGADGKQVVKDKKFASDEKGTGEQHAMTALSAALGPQQAEQYREPILRHAYLFRVSPLWLIISYMVISLGELMLSPMGLSLVSKVAPIRMRGLLMGGWFVATAIGNKLTAIGVYWSIWKHSSFFIVLGGMAFVMAFVLLFLLRPLKKAMPGV
jgi:POT family proton-dependent oligopeptide transporter